MIIDNDEVSSYIFSRLSTISGFAKKIVNCETGEIALDYLLKHINRPSRLPEVIFLDLNLKESGGWDFIKSFEALDPEIKNNTYLVILTMTALEDEELKAARFPSVKKSLVKPITVDNLRSINEVINSRHVKDRKLFNSILP
jgi:CheY-like chemotaxis protein